MMSRWLTLTIVALIAVAAPVSAAGISGQYIEARNCDVWTGPCFANSVINLTGRNAVMGWKVDKGTLDNVRLDGLSIVAVIAASNTLGIEQTAPAKAILIVDAKANARQREALISLAKKQGGDLLKEVIHVESGKVDLCTTACKKGGCGYLEAGKAHIETRCLDHHDKACGNESAFYPPLAKNVKAEAAMATKHGFEGQEFNTTWIEHERRGAYVGSFAIQ